MKGLVENLNLSLPPATMRLPIYVSIREKYGIDIRICPKCKEQLLELVATHNRTATVLGNEKTKNKESPTEL
ncbi:MAG: hypothetical protein Q8K92_02365 [Leadbetterella sp.]|nr:hypothetical protein [Leadbetterella sp.]